MLYELERRVIQSSIDITNKMANTKSGKRYMRDGKFTPEFDELVKEKLDRWHVPGMSIAVIQDDEVCAKV